ncbi:Uncharacterised protein [Achromobacter sp. 2789STDY5608633]|nr:Uncharacterised protein [Achromobacter sp. 2789STDY5608633]
MRFGICHVGQAGLLRRGGEFQEIAGRVDRLQVFVQQIVIGLSAQLAGGFLQRRAQRVALPQAALDQFQHGLGANQLVLRRFRAEAVQDHGVADHVGRLPARIGVVADVGDALRRQVFAADAQDRVTHLRRHPAEHAVADDVVESAEVGGDVRQAHGPQVEITRARRFRDQPARVNLLRRQVDADDAGLGVGQREWQQVAAGGAAQFQHPGLLQRRRRQLVQVRDRAQVAGRGVGKGQGNVRGFVVGVGNGLRQDVGCAHGEIPGIAVRGRRRIAARTIIGVSVEG